MTLTAPLAERDDEMLVRAIRAAAPDAAAAEDALCRRYRRRAELFALRYLRDPAAAEDFAQQALLVALEKMRAGEPADPARVGPFILGICRLLVRNEVRTGRRRRALLQWYGDPLAGDGQTPPAGATEAADARLGPCMERLAEKARAVVVLSFYADRTAGEIAAELGLSAGNVRVIRHRALADLNACMEART